MPQVFFKLLHKHVVAKTTRTAALHLFARVVSRQVRGGPRLRARVHQGHV